MAFTVCREVDVRQAVVIYVTNSNATAIVEI